MFVMKDSTKSLALLAAAVFPVTGYCADVAPTPRMEVMEIPGSQLQGKAQNQFKVKFEQGDGQRPVATRQGVKEHPIHSLMSLMGRRASRVALSCCPCS